MNWPIRKNALFSWQVAAAALLTLAKISGASAAENAKAPSPLHIDEALARCFFEAAGGNPATLAYLHMEQVVYDGENQSMHSPEDHPFVIYKGQSSDGLSARLVVTPDPFVFEGTKTNPGVSVAYFEPDSERPFSITQIESDDGSVSISSTVNSYWPNVYYLIIVASDFSFKHQSITTSRQMPDADFKSQLLQRSMVNDEDSAAVQTARERLLKMNGVAVHCLTSN
jgi:hypothetical protein